MPPPRPLHRYPSWENRIYQVASEGMKDAISGGESIDTTNNNSYRSDINVPVYATVKGVSGSRTLVVLYYSSLLTTTLSSTL